MFQAVPLVGLILSDTTSVAAVPRYNQPRENSTIPRLLIGPIRGDKMMRILRTATA